MMKCETQPFDIEAKVRQDCYNRGYEQGRKNPAEEIVEYIEKLQKQVKEYQDKIEQGTLIELPCNVGDTVYQFDNGGEIYELIILSVTIFKNKIYYETIGIDFDNTAIGQSIFLTREEVEKRLLELQGDK